MKFPSYDQLQARHTMKWTRYPADVIPLWVAESDFDTCEPIQKALEKAVANQSYGYQPDDSALPEATAAFYQSRYGYPARSEWIFPVPDVVRALYIAVTNFTRPDSPVIVPTPTYPPFTQLLQASDRKGIFLDATGGLDLAEVEQAFAQGAGSIILANPFNPLGYTFGADFLKELTDLAARYDARVLVDEIHAPLVYDNSHIVAAGASPTAAEVCITATATSKAWNTAGLKCAQIIFSNPNDVEKWNSLSPVIKDGASTIGLLAAETAYREGQEFLDEEIAYLAENKEFLSKELPKAIPGIKVPDMTATYLMWLDFSDTNVPGNPSEFFLENAKVMMNDGAWFGPYPTFTRLNFATSREILVEAVARMGEALKKVQSAAQSH